MSRKILVIVEHNEGNIKNVSREILSFCSHFGEKRGYVVEALLYGNDLSENLYKQIGESGIECITYINDSRLKYHNPDIINPTLIKMIDETMPEFVFFGNTSIAKDLAPWLAQHFSSQMISDVIDIDFSDSQIKFKRPIYGGRVIEKIKVVNKDLLFVTIRPNSLGLQEGKSKEIFTRGINLEDKPLRYIVKDVVSKEKIELPINEAEVIVAGGRAFKSEEDFSILHELADIIDATVGASRPIIDMGIKRRSLQIGQSGKSVSPRLIFVCGVSGQIQFVAGIGNAKTVISINRDSGATIFKTSDYGIVGDVYKIIPIISKRLKKSI